MSAQEWQTPINLPDWRNFEYISIDCETKDPNLKDFGPGAARGDSELIGFSARTDVHAPIYIPLMHAGGGIDSGNYHEPENALRWLKHYMEIDVPKIAAHINYEISQFRAVGIRMAGQKIDVQIMTALIDENRQSYSLDNISKDYLGFGKDETLLKETAEKFGFNPKSELHRLHAKYVGPYAEMDAELPHLLYPVLLRKLEEQDLIAPFLEECEFTDLLHELHWNGVRIDRPKAREVWEEFNAAEQVARARILDMTGLEVAEWEPGSCARLFDHLGLEYGVTPKSKKPQFKQIWLEKHAHEVGPLLAIVRKNSKAKRDFLDTFVQFCDKNDRVHPSILQTRTEDENGEFGGSVSRMACKSPNLQQIPARDPNIGPRVRQLIVPNEGELMLSCDYNSQEPRILTHFAAALKADGYQAVLHEYKENKKYDFYSPLIERAGVPREVAKPTTLSKVYGAGVAKTATQIGRDEAFTKDVRNYVDRTFPFIKTLANTTSDLANKRGWVKEIGGRKMRFDQWEIDQRWPRPGSIEEQIKQAFGLPKSREEAEALKTELEKKFGRRLTLKRGWLYKALNRIIQGSACTQTKRAMLGCWKAGFTPLQPIHDELLFSISNENHVKEIVDIMENAVQFHVPSYVKAKFGPNFGQLLPFEVG